MLTSMDISRACVLSYLEIILLGMTAILIGYKSAVRARADG